ncbi:MAG: phosphate ABC transporter ATP-binding protein [Methyloceanibacter sp.]|jgi:tungstate transport system ATP-binding protein|nr:phosphate ABC transporter ATP-binding protein [Methyloceanibacter sp.]
MLDKPTSFTPQALALTADRLLPLELKGLSLAAGGRRLIDGVNLSLERPGISVVMGPNGAGKSLLLRLIHGLIAPTKGDILWAGIPMNAQIMRRQAMVFQKPVLLRRTAAANITHALGLRGVIRSERRPRAYQALQLAGLENHASTPARVLSGGEQQRLCLARALSLVPDVLFLDEPTASLDPASTLAIERLLIDAQHIGIKVIVVTHDVGQARRLAQDVIFLHHGRVIEHQPASRFFREPDSEVARAFIAGGLVL